MAKPPPVFPTPTPPPLAARIIPQKLAAQMTAVFATKPGTLAVQAAPDYDSQHFAGQLEGIFGDAGWKVEQRGDYAGPNGTDVSAPDNATRAWVTQELLRTGFNIREKNSGGDKRVWIQIGPRP